MDTSLTGLSFVQISLVLTQCPFFLPQDPTRDTVSHLVFTSLSNSLDGDSFLDFSCV